MIAKAGQGAFGSVYVALWKGLVVAVKVMRQQAEGRRAMRTAWELAVTKSVSHPNIVMVYATFTDVVVVKLSKRLIRFVPAATTLADPAMGAPSGGTSSGGGGPAAGEGAAASQGAASDASARCQVRRWGRGVNNIPRRAVTRRGGEGGANAGEGVCCSDRGPVMTSYESQEGGMPDHAVRESRGLWLQWLSSGE